MNIASKLSALLMLAAVIPALAATKTVTLDVPSMTCPVTTVAALTKATTDAGYPSTMKSQEKK